MEPASEIFAVSRVGDTLVVTPTSDLNEPLYQPLEAGVRRILSLLADPAVKNVVVDFQETNYFGSTALGLLVRLWKRVTERHGRMALCNLSGHEREILRVARLDSLWPVFPSKVEAVRMVSQ